MSTNNTTVTTKKSLEDNQKLMVGNSVTNLRIGISKTEKRLLDLNVILLNYRTNEGIVRARLQNNTRAVDMQLSGSQTRSDPVNSFSMSNTKPNPHKQIPVEQYNALHRSYGTPELLTTLNSIDYDIKETETLIKKLETELFSFKAQLAEAEAKFKNPFGFLRGILPPTAADLEKDAIQKSQLSNLSLLYQMSTAYRSLSTDTNGRRAFSDDQSMSQNLMKLKATFQAHASLFPEYIEPKGPKALTFDDPGSDWNLKILNEDQETIRTVGISDKADAATAEYAKTVTMVANSSNLSKGLSTKSDPKLLPEQSLNHKTRVFSATATRMGVSYKGSFELPDVTSGIKKWWKNKNKDLMVGLPLCPNAPKPIQTSTDTSPVRQAQDTADELAKSQGQTAFVEAMAKATALQDKINKSSEIPGDAPQWVTLYSNVQGEAEIGSIKFQGSDYYVTRVVADNQTIAKDKSRDINIPGNNLNISLQYADIAQYAYVPGGTTSTSSEGPVQQTLIYYTLWKLKEEPTEALPADQPELTPDQKRSMEISVAIDALDKKINALGGNLPKRDSNNYYDPKQVSQANEKVKNAELETLYVQKNALIEEQRALFPSETKNKNEGTILL